MDIRDICLVMAGNVDSGKSTTLGVITSLEQKNDRQTNETIFNMNNNMIVKLDNGKGSARSKIAKHPHEIKQGKTSDISTKTIKLDGRDITFVDICGHEKYLKTTLYGMVGHFPDYGIVVISANRGITKITKEHIGVLLYLRIPFIVLITRVDMTPEPVYKSTIEILEKLLGMHKRKTEFINDLKDINLSSDKLIEKENSIENNVIKIAKRLRTNPYIVPVISISNTTGYYIRTTMELIRNLEPTNLWNNATSTNDTSGTVFYIDCKFAPPGIGLVVSGLTSGKINKNTDMYIGPYGNEFKSIRVWSLHNNTKQNVDTLQNRQRGCLAIKSNDKKFELTKDSIRKGMIVLSHDAEQSICYEFTARIEVLHHSTTISEKYAPVIHCGIIRQPAKIITAVTLKTGESSEIKFRFVHNSEYMKSGMTFFFRDGGIKGFGTVISVLLVKNDPHAHDEKPNIKKRTYNKRKV